MFTVTFYSYKGGVGRTLALMNVARRLSLRDKKVFVIDFDLEAPGVHAFDETAQEKLGLVDYITKYASDKVVPELREYVTSVEFENPHSSINVLTAGAGGGNYHRYLAEIDWKQLYANDDGFLLLENLKESIREQFKPDYLLIDSRTGLTDISGICTVQLPDLVVLLFGLNKQNLEGIAKVHDSILHNDLNREVRTLLVASPVPELPELLVMRASRFAEIKRVLGQEPDLAVPFTPAVSFVERLVMPNVAEDPLSRAYDLLCKAVVERNSEDVSSMLSAIAEVRELGDSATAKEMFNELITTRASSADAWSAYAQFLIGIGDEHDALDAINHSLEIRGTPEDYARRAMLHLRAKDYASATQDLATYLSGRHEPRTLSTLGQLLMAHNRLVDAERVYSILSNSSDRAYEENGLNVLGLMKLRAGMYKEAVDALQKLVELSPSSYSANLYLGLALIRLGNPSRGRQLLEKAVQIQRHSSQWTSGAGISDKANISQELGCAFGHLGQRKQAFAFLHKALELSAELRSKKVFSVASFGEVSVADFTSQTLDLLDEFQPDDPVFETLAPVVMRQIAVLLKWNPPANGPMRLSGLSVPEQDVWLSEHRARLSIAIRTIATEQLGDSRKQPLSYRAVVWGIAERLGIHHSLAATINDVEAQIVETVWNQTLTKLEPGKRAEIERKVTVAGAGAIGTILAGAALSSGTATALGLSSVAVPFAGMLGFALGPVGLAAVGLATAAAIFKKKHETVYDPVTPAIILIATNRIRAEDSTPLADESSEPGTKFESKAANVQLDEVACEFYKKDYDRLSAENQQMVRELASQRLGYSTWPELNGG